jgi:superfamily II DNA or RNA helicase
MRKAMREFSMTLCLPATRPPYNPRFPPKGPPPKDKYFVGWTVARDEIRYHINHLNDFKKVLWRHYIEEKDIEWVNRPMYKPNKSYLKMTPGWVPRPKQIPAIEYIVNPESPVSKAVILQTGGGKTALVMNAMTKAGVLPCTFLSSDKYIQQWLRDFRNNCVIKDKKRICVIKGADALKGLIDMASEGPVPFDAIIISSTTFARYITEYNNHSQHLEKMTGYGVAPDFFFEHVGIGMRVIDELHQNFHFNFLLDLYTHAPSSVGLTGTLMSDSDMVNRMMKVAYPEKDRHDKDEYEKYAYAYSLHYNVRTPRLLRTKQAGMGTYSHIEFEKSIMRDRNMQNNYFHMVRESLRHTYDVNYRQPNRCLVYFATIEMCTRFTAWIKREYPDRMVTRFVEEDSYDDLMKAAVSISTLKSAGTGIDIPDLVTVILTVGVNASPSNLQGYGRLRNLKDDRKLQFLYLVCDDVPKQVEYHERKLELLKTRALACEKRYYANLI